VTVIDLEVGERPSFVHDIRVVAGRALRQMPREPASLIPAVFVPAFFYAVNLGALEKLAGTSLDYRPSFCRWPSPLR
jgi:ABC-2 type transport system permease protein